MMTNICTTVFFCVLAICITIGYIQNIKIKHDSKLSEVSRKLKSDIEYQRHMKETYKMIIEELGIQSLSEQLNELKETLNKTNN